MGYFKYIKSYYIFWYLNFLSDEFKGNSKEDQACRTFKRNYLIKTELKIIHRKRRIINRTKIIKEELMQVTWHPDKVQKWLDMGEKVFAMMIGDDPMI